MKPLEFLIWLRDEVGVIRHSKEGNRLDKPSNGELRRWIQKNALFCNGQTVEAFGVIEFPITSLVLFPQNDKARCSLV